MAAPRDTNARVLSDINVTPLVDVLLVLLLVLMVSASAAVARALNVNLPSAASGHTETSTVTLRIDAEGRFWLGDAAIDLETLGARLARLGPAQSLAVIIAADAASRHGQVIQLLDVLRRENITHVAFAVRSEAQATRAP